MLSSSALCWFVLTPLVAPHPRSPVLDPPIRAAPRTAWAADRDAGERTHAGAGRPWNVMVNHRAGDPPGRVQSETSLAVAGDTMVAVWNDAAGFLGPEALTGVGVSLDGGTTWTDLGAVPQGPDTDVMGDPAVVALATGEFLIACVDLGNDDGIALARLTPIPGGGVWGDTHTFVRNGGEYLDKPALMASASGDVHLGYVNWSQNRGELCRSTDGGETWTDPLTIFESSRANGIALAEGPLGEVHVVWTDPIGEGGGTIWSRCLVGAQWVGPATAVATLGPRSHDPPRGFDRPVGPTFASLAVDRSGGPHRGVVYVAWSDGQAGHFDVWVSASADGGITWGEPVRVNDNADPTESFWPRVDVGDDGRVSVLWYDRRRDLADVSACEVMVAQSLDGGASFGPNRPASSVAAPWEGVPADMVPNFGDYVAHAVGDHAVYGLWSDARDGDPDVVFGRVDDVVTIDVTGAGSGDDGVAWRVAAAASLPVGVTIGGAELIAALSHVLLAWPVSGDGLWTPDAGRIITAIDVDAGGAGRLSGIASMTTSSPSAVALDVTGSVDTLTFDVDAVTSLDLVGSMGPGASGGATLHGALTLVVAGDTLATTVGLLVSYPDDPGRTLAKPVEVRASGRRRPASSDLLTTWRLESPESGAAPPAGAAPGVGLPVVSVRVDPMPARGPATVVVTTDRSITARVGVYTTAGRRLRELVPAVLPAGTHRVPFDRTGSDGRRLAAGVYFVRLSTSELTAHSKVIFVGP